MRLPSVGYKRQQLTVNWIFLDVAEVQLFKKKTAEKKKRRTRKGEKPCKVRVPVPDRPPGWTDALFCAAGLLNVEAGTTLPFLGADAVLEYVFAAVEVGLSTASL